MSRPTYSANRKISPERIERCARMYPSNQEAAAALDITPGSFSRLCRQNNIDTPQVRRRKRNAEFRKQCKKPMDTEPTAEDIAAIDQLLADDIYAP